MTEDKGFSRSSAGWTNGLISHKGQKSKCKVLQLVWNNAIQHYSLRGVYVENSFAEELGTWPVLWMTRWSWAKVVVWQQRQRLTCLVVLARCSQQAEGSGLLPQCSTNGTKLRILCPVWGSPVEENHWTVEQVQQRTHKISRVMDKEKLKKLSLFSLKMKQMGLGEALFLSEYLIRGYRCAADASADSSCRCKQ